MKPLERVVFFTLIAVIPIQLGKHFWPNFSFIQGIRVDYLSPTLYVSDVFFIILFLLSIHKLWRQIFHLIRIPIVAIFFITIMYGTVVSQNPPPALYGVIKLCEFGYLVLYISNFFTQKHISVLLYLFSLGGIVETIILIFQFFAQRSLGGFFYYLGERTFNASTPGIATFQINGQLLLRPYGTFPHPNVLAFYLLFGFVFLLYSLDFQKEIATILKTCVMIILTIGIFLTFSRIVIVLLVLVTGVWLVKKFKLARKKFKIVLASSYLFILVILFLLLFRRFEASFMKDLLSRLDLARITIVIVQKYPLFGVGFNNFYYHEILFQKNITPTLLQPVHNIYLLILVQIGAIGALLTTLIIKKMLKVLIFRFKNKDYYSEILYPTILLLIGTASIGLFDHYPVTLQQGQVIFAVLTGLLFVKKKA